MKSNEKNLYNFKSLTNLRSQNSNNIDIKINKLNLSSENLNKDLNSEDETTKSKLSLTDDELKERIKHLSNQQLCSSKRMLNYCEESEIFGVNTGRLLDEQDEKLQRIEKDLGLMGAELNDVEKNLNELKNAGCCFSFCILVEILGDLFCFCCKKSKKTNKSNTNMTVNKSKSRQLAGIFGSASSTFTGGRSGSDLKKRNQSSNLTSSDESESIKTSKFTLKKFLSSKSLNRGQSSNTKNFMSSVRLRKIDSNGSNLLKATNLKSNPDDYSESLNDMKEQLNVNLKTIYNQLDNLQSMAFDIGSKINKQNEKISHMDQSTDFTITKVKSTDNIGRRLVNSKSNKSIISINMDGKKLNESKSLKSLKSIFK